MSPKAKTAGSRECSTCGDALDRHPVGDCPICGRSLHHHDGRRPSDLEWRGRARMAHARSAAGLSLSPVDREALDRFPACPPLGWAG